MFQLHFVVCVLNVERGDVLPRPVKPRRIAFMPKNKYFLPLGKRKCELDEIKLKLEELEAMRLKDIEKLSQEECAQKMNVSRQTFQLIIDSARKKVAQALTEGKAINIEGGNYTLNICKYKCNNCGLIFDEAYEKEVRSCPKCNSNDIQCIDKDVFCHKRCRRRKGCIL
ncbi:DUF134 domain-containing protein [Caminicella sporogenes]|uniref:DUF134 domain-containing protein n=1 Tax=Caminicella sporogenes TaxID=166485 RepID=UPI002F42451A